MVGVIQYAPEVTENEDTKGNTVVSWASPRVAGTAESTASLGTMLFACTLLAAQRHPGTCSVFVQEAGQCTTMDERRQREEEGEVAQRGVVPYNCSGR